MKSINDYYTFERITKNMARTFGTMKKGTEADFAFEMASIEGNLLKMHRKNNKNNSWRTLDAIRICLFIIDGYVNGLEYDLSKYRTPENEPMVEAILMACDPFTNEAIRETLINNYDWHSTEDLRKYFTTYIQCLLRIEESVQLWTKRTGPDGYYIFTEDYMGHMVQYDDKMNFSASLREPSQSGEC